jgi:hypothetical protein
MSAADRDRIARAYLALRNLRKVRANTRPKLSRPA